MAVTLIVASYGLLLTTRPSAVVALVVAACLTACSVFLLTRPTAKGRP